MKLTNAILTTLGWPPTPAPAGPEIVALLSSAPQPSTAQALAAAREASYEPQPGVSEGISRLQKLWEATTAEITRHTQRAADEAHRAHEQILTEKIAAGKSIEAHDSWTRDDWREDYRQKLSALKRSQHVHSAEAWALVRPELSRFADAVGSDAEQIETNQRSLADAFAAPFVPSNVLVLLRKIEAQARKQANEPWSNCGNAPATVAGFIIL